MYHTLVEFQSPVQNSDVGKSSADFLQTWTQVEDSDFAAKASEALLPHIHKPFLSQQELSTCVHQETEYFPWLLHLWGLILETLRTPRHHAVLKMKWQWLFSLMVPSLLCMLCSRAVKEIYCMMETQVKLVSLLEGIWIYLSDVAEEGSDHWDVWVLGRRMDILCSCCWSWPTVFRVKLNPCGQKELSGSKERVIKAACVGG